MRITFFRNRQLWQSNRKNILIFISKCALYILLCNYSHLHANHVDDDVGDVSRRTGANKSEVENSNVNYHGEKRVAWSEPQERSELTGFSVMPATTLKGRNCSILSFGDDVQNRASRFMRWSTIELIRHNCKKLCHYSLVAWAIEAKIGEFSVSVTWWYRAYRKYSR